MDSAELRKTKKIKSNKKNIDAWNLFDAEIGGKKNGMCLFKRKR